MNINLQIDRLILNGIDLSPSQRRRLQVAIEGELAHLLTVQGLPADWQAGGTIANLPANLTVTPAQASAQDPSSLGQQIAQSIYTGLRGGAGGGLNP
ncbi:hypothetical protein [Leptolyngbya sp. FACHB-261]|uniref:hypothetical protein n=1 Tax=Leptolyngbya sp. FACHB-261 TaxID=2692806 RepID=UPI0016848B77|nr:hypothetical protein [Leptolyngbya sp. FACHB-261]MBD2102589.1 hypothetical protein [Leptolyngbya sp. FACHB-261]